MDIRGEYIVKQLQHLPPHRGLIVKNGHAIIRCPRHKGGNEQTPSLYINLDSARATPGVFRCWSCPFRGNYTTLAKEFGLEGLPSELEHRVYPLNLSDDTVLLDKPTLLPKGKNWASNRIWRNISGELLSELDCVTLKVSIDEERLILPCHQFDELRGWISCSLDGNDPKYLYMRDNGKKWILNTLFPYDYVKRRWWGQPLHLVEGPRDALNLIQFGIPALAILGSQTWSLAKRTAVLALNCTGIFLTFDPDAAGISAAEKIGKNLRHRVKIIRVALPATIQPDKSDKIDPGNLTKEQAYYIHKMLLYKLLEKRK